MPALPGRLKSGCHTQMLTVSGRALVDVDVLVDVNINVVVVMLLAVVVVVAVLG